MADAYADLSFALEQLFLSQEECFDVASDFWTTGSLTASQLTDRDRAFLQRALLIAVQVSEQAGFLFDLYSSAVKAVPKRSVMALVKGLAKRTAKRFFKQYIDDTPKISAVGKSGVQHSSMGTEWRLRVGMQDDGELTNYLLAD
jgi:hypothetical protein